MVRGDVVDGMHIVSGADIVVCGTVYGAQLTAGGDITINGGASGKLCRCIAQGDIALRQVESAQLSAAGNAVVVRDARLAHITCRGAMVVRQGVLSGGQITAAGGVRCMVLGTPSGMATLVEAGIDPAMREVDDQLILEIEKLQEKVRHHEESLRPFQDHRKAISPQDKERATELMYELEEINQELKGAIDRLREVCDPDTVALNPRIVVKQTIHAGVTIRLDAYEAQIKSAIAGPVSIELQRHGGPSGIVVVDTDSGSHQALATAAFVDAKVQRIRKIFQP